MKTIQALLFLIIAPFISNSQDKFEIKLKAQSYIKDSLILGVPDGIPTGFEELYDFKIEPNDKINDLKVTLGFPNSYYSIQIQNENLLNGTTDCPKLVNFIYSNPLHEEMPTISGVFFIEKGTLKIDLPRFKNNHEVIINSPANIDLRKLKKSLSKVYVKSKTPMMPDSLINFEQKQQILKKHILQYPSSYAALWSIIYDYNEFHQEQNYQENLKYFSSKMRNSKLFKDFKFKMDAENASSEGKTLPEITLNDNLRLTIDDYSKHELTLIDYWSTTCAPCIRAIPEILETYEKYKTIGLNIVSISDDVSDERIKMANEILKKNKVTWQNYFDLKNDFRNKVNAIGYPFYLLIDKNGKILLRTLGDFELVKDLILEKLPNSKK